MSGWGIDRVLFMHNVCVCVCVCVYVSPGHLGPYSPDYSSSSLFSLFFLSSLVFCCFLIMLSQWVCGGGYSLSEQQITALEFWPVCVWEGGKDGCPCVIVCRPIVQGWVVFGLFGH